MLVMDIPVTEVKTYQKRHYIEYDMADPSLEIGQVYSLQDDVKVDWDNQTILIKIC